MNLIEPAGLWDVVRACLARRGRFASLAVIPVLGALAVATASEIGVREFNGEWNAVFGYSARPDNDGTRFTVLWLALALAPFVQGIVGALVLPLYSLPRRWRAALAVSVVGAVPLYVSGLAMIMLPGIILVLGGLLHQHCLVGRWCTRAARRATGRMPRVRRRHTRGILGIAAALVDGFPLLMAAPVSSDRPPRRSRVPTRRPQEIHHVNQASARSQPKTRA